MPYSVIPQNDFRCVASIIPQFAVLEHDLDGTGKWLHRDLELVRQIGLVVGRLKRTP
jgi:hypothetical protein